VIAISLILSNIYIGIGLLVFASGFPCAHAEAATTWSTLNQASLTAFCDSNSRFGQSQWAFQLTEPELQTRIAAAQDSSFLNRGSPWINSTYPNEWVRLKNHYGAWAADLPRDSNDPEAVLKFLNTFPASDHYAWSKNAKADLLRTEEWRADEEHLDQHQDLKKMIKLAPLLCADQGAITDSFACVDAIKKVVAVMAPVGDVTLFNLLKKIFLDVRYSNAAIHLATTIETKILLGGQPSGDLLTDAIASTRASGFGSQSEDAAFEILAFYSSNGPNSAGYTHTWTSKENAGFYYGLTVLGTGITVLNSRSMSSGHPYSYPPSVASTCDNGKPYHFWMTAYLARLLTHDMAHPRSVRTAVYITSVGYQMMSTSSGRDPSLPYKLKSDAPQNQKIRMDLAYAAAGAEFGALAGSRTLKATESTTISVDQSLRNLLKNAAPLSALTEEEVQDLWSGTGISAYRRWMKIFNPIKAMASFPNL
jgi:hypothetical protein